MKRAFVPADILLPADGVDMTKWSVVACDQYTSEAWYWDKVESIVDGAPSTYDLILPEVFLGTSQEEEKLGRINANMDKYLKDGLFREYKDALIYLERKDSEGKVRAGLVGAIDLEEYDFSAGSRSMVRATEATVISRIPPRVKVRENASLELPHIMILIDDPQKSVIEKVGETKDRQKKLYDFTLMQGGGSIEGYLLDETAKEIVLSGLDKLADEQGENPLVFAMGDGNHSLATAKTHYENLKKIDKDSVDTKLARYALVELVNLHSSALEFEAIHRIIKDVDVAELIGYLEDKIGFASTTEEDIQTKGIQLVKTVINGAGKVCEIKRPVSTLTVGSLQTALDEYLNDHKGEIDYIHGEDTVISLSKEKDSVAFILPDMKKEELFPAVKAQGVLPRKTFSMGHAADKRFYLECRKIKA